MLNYIFVPLLVFQKVLCRCWFSKKFAPQNLNCAVVVVPKSLLCKT